MTKQPTLFNGYLFCNNKCLVIFLQYKRQVLFGTRGLISYLWVNTQGISRIGSACFFMNKSRRSCEQRNQTIQADLLAAITSGSRVTGLPCSAHPLANLQKYYVKRLICQTLFYDSNARIFFYVLKLGYTNRGSQTNCFIKPQQTQ